MIGVTVTNFDKSTAYLQEHCERVDYVGTLAYYDGRSYYNENAELLRNLAEYNSSSEGYTPFGDEGYDY